MQHKKKALQQTVVLLRVECPDSTLMIGCAVRTVYWRVVRTFAWCLRDVSSKTLVRQGYPPSRSNVVQDWLYWCFAVLWVISLLDSLVGGARKSVIAMMPSWCGQERGWENSVACG